MTRLRPRRRTRHDQRGLTLIEILIGMVIAGLIMGPLAAWAFGTLQTQSISKDELGRANSTGLLSSYYLRDAASARSVSLPVDGASDCTNPVGPPGPSAGGAVAVRFFRAGTPATSVVYSFVGGSTAPYGDLWRRQCGPDGSLVGATKVFSRVVTGSAVAGCPEADGSPVAGECADGVSRKVTLSIRPYAAPGVAARPPIVLSATRRTGAGSVGLASSSPPDPRITLSPIRGFRGTQFTATSASTDPDGGVLSLKWTLPPGATAVGDGDLTKGSVTFTLTATGPVILVVTDSSGAVSATEATVEIVNRNPTVSASCTAQPLRTFALAATANDVDGDPLTYQWSTSDGAGYATSTALWSPAASLSGDQLITVVVEDGAGGQSTAFTTCAVPAAEPPPGSVTISPGPISGTGDTPFVNAIPQGGALTVTFTAVDPIPAGSQTSFELFRQGNSTAVNSKADATVWSVPFVPGEQGAYEIVRVTKLATGDVIRSTPQPFVVNAAPTATLSISASAGSAPAQILTFDSTASDADGRVVSQVWDFGDGSPKETDPGPAPSHTYTAAGTYQVILGVTDDRGAVTLVSTTVTVAA